MKQNNMNEYLYLQNTWNGKTSNSVCITLYNDTNIYLRMTEKVKYISTSMEIRKITI